MPPNQKPGAGAESDYIWKKPVIFAIKHRFIPGAKTWDYSNISALSPGYR